MITTLLLNALHDMISNAFCRGVVVLLLILLYALAIFEIIRHLHGRRILFRLCMIILAFLIGINVIRLCTYISFSERQLQPEYIGKIELLNVDYDEEGRWFTTFSAPSDADGLYSDVPLDTLMLNNPQLTPILNEPEAYTFLFVYGGGNVHMTYSVWDRCGWYVGTHGIHMKYFATVSFDESNDKVWYIYRLPKEYVVNGENGTWPTVGSFF